MLDPVSTYRIQFHAGFTFDDFRKVIPYLVSLGVRTVYASPIFESVPGSTHGYDGLNPHRINPEIGTEEELRAVSQTLRAHGISWLQDIVPNHMAFHPGNAWLMDVLESGQRSHYARFFDISWHSPVHEGRLMVPFLGTSLSEVLEKGELTLGFADGRFSLAYFDAAYPLHPASYLAILAGDEEVSDNGRWDLVEALGQLDEADDDEDWQARWADWKEQFRTFGASPAGSAWITKRLSIINANPSMLEEIAGQQVYSLCHWQETDARINYRRFFTVNGLICLNIHEPSVFDEYHQYIYGLVRDGVFQGLRIDHIDGLYDPTAYLQKLRALVGEKTYVVAEKILEADERLPSYWPLQGNSGYDFLALVNNLFTNAVAEGPLTRYYLGLAGDYRTVQQRVRDSKAHILYHHMSGELENLCRLFHDQHLVDGERLERIGPDLVRQAIGAFLIHCPVYRFYSAILPLVGEEAHATRTIFEAIRQTEPHLSEAIDLLQECWLKRPAAGDEAYNLRAVHFFKRCGQFSGPIMAKGVEDTLMYSYNRFIAHNEVGDAVDAFGITVDDFHQRMKERQETWPLSLNATSTHDTKRGEDVRARLNVLTDLAGEWTTEVDRWMELIGTAPGKNMPDANDVYFLFQTIAGAYPMPGQDVSDLLPRLGEYLVKSVREAKRHSNWTSPNEDYEQAFVALAGRLLDPGSPFLCQAQPFLARLADHGILNSLTQVLLKFTLPGVPDVYQGCESWDLSLVDPDNRRPVDFEQRQRWLREIDEGGEEVELKGLWEDRYSGRIKLWLVRKLLQIRSRNAALFQLGEYVPLRVTGQHSAHVFAFARRAGSTCLVVVAPLRMAALRPDPETRVDWADTCIDLPAGLTGTWKELVHGTEGGSKGQIHVAELFRELPLAVLETEALLNSRSAGILMHLTSLPSAYGIGDLGPEADAFAGFLQRSRQSFWQLLPINPTEAGQGHSPYSSTSSYAGNTLLISPELLAADGLLTTEELAASVCPRSAQVSYRDAERVKKELLQKAWERYSASTKSDAEFDAFCEAEGSWLTDFARYRILKEANDGKPWYEWPDAFKRRDERTLAKLDVASADLIRREKWWQYLFHRQWVAFKKNCNDRGVRLIGDLPFYVSYDSVDVWSNQGLFKLDEAGARLGVAGVPPDSFSADGQLWGMPVFRWDVLRESNYAWWIERLRKNRQFFDLVRLDHFRAFAAYWEVPAGAETAKEGAWQEGPGASFFQVVRTALGEMPFIAEDLGEIDDTVRKLRDDFGLPGMKILQFAFGDDLPRSEYIPHNYGPNFIVYTGTHDNNTTRGWYRDETSADMRHRIDQYIGEHVTEESSPFALARLAYGSVAGTVILPLQDVLGLDASARMNTPASAADNWGWRLLPGQLTDASVRLLNEWTRIFNRR
ncbi:MAG: malto-oligosyltrehalose synthase [Flaviaesturariibacter sp.]|nr:malto-oligosyltrehalose synthase [Flaviaesturariibacter sp.]